jgi:hypothetical protein
LVQTVIDMGLARAFVGFGSVKGPLDQKALKGPRDVLAYVAAHQIADRYPTTEALLGADPDFYFAGWASGRSMQHAAHRRLLTTAERVAAQKRDEVKARAKVLAHRAGRRKA